MIAMPSPIDLTLPYGYLETVGRRTGLLRETEIWFTGEPGHVYLRSGGGVAKDWIRNAQRQPRVRFRIGDAWLTGTLRLVMDEPELDEHIRELFAAKYPVADFGNNPAARNAWLETSTPIAIDLDED
jgi:deazaflavin-dependent oxidoreductase (nitroreductase family)